MVEEDEEDEAAETRVVLLELPDSSPTDEVDEDDVEAESDGTLALLVAELALPTPEDPSEEDEASINSLGKWNADGAALLGATDPDPDALPTDANDE